MKKSRQSFLDYFDNVAKLLTGIAFVSWMIQEWVIPHDKIFLFVAIVFGLADVFYLVLHRFLPRKHWIIIIGWTVYAGVVFLIAKNPSELKKIEVEPLVTVDVGQSLDRSNAFATTLTIQNGNSYAISNVIYRVLWQDVALFGPSKWWVFIDGTRIPFINPGGKYAVVPDPMFKQMTLRPEAKSYFNFEIEFIQESWNHPKVIAFRFCVTRDAAGGYVCIQAGPGQTMSEISKSDTNAFWIIMPSIQKW